jgi:type VI secretion system secreted protein Hcp
MGIAITIIGRLRPPRLAAVAGHFKTGELMEDTKNRSSARVGHHLMVGAFAAAATVGATTVAASDLFLKIGDIKGETADKNHPNEIEVLSWSWGVSGPTAGDTKKAGQPACGQPLSVSKYVDKATPPLVTNAVLNTTIPSAKLTVRKAGATPIEFLVVDFAGVTVKELRNGGSINADRMSENLTLGFASATITYTPQNPDGSAGTPVSATTPASCP